MAKLLTETGNIETLATQEFVNTRSCGTTGGIGEESDPIYAVDKPLLALKSELPDISGLATKQEVQEVKNDLPDLSELAHKDDFAAVALSGSYHDLTDKPDDTPTMTDLQGIADDIVNAIKQHFDDHTCGTAPPPPPPVYPEDRWLTEQSIANCIQAAEAMKEFKHENDFTLSVVSDTHVGHSAVTSVLVNDDGETNRSLFSRSLAGVGAAIRTSRLVEADAICHLGDMMDGNSPDSPITRVDFQSLVHQIVDKIRLADCPFCFAMGNHDSNDAISGRTVTAYWQDWWYTNVISKTPQAVTKPGKGYYYVDFPAKKVRLITLCFMDIPETLLQYLPLSSHSSFWGFSGEQMKWLGDTALDLSGKGADAKNWDIVVVTHSAINNVANGTTVKNMAQLAKLLDAWQEKTTIDIGIGTAYPGSTSSGFTAHSQMIAAYTYGYQKDFSQRAGGRILGVVSGHRHQDWNFMPDKPGSEEVYLYGVTDRGIEKCHITKVPTIMVANAFHTKDGYASIVNFSRSNNKITVRGICEANALRLQRLKPGVDTTLDLTDHTAFRDFDPSTAQIIPLRQANMYPFTT